MLPVTSRYKVATAIRSLDYISSRISCAEKALQDSLTQLQEMANEENCYTNEQKIVINDTFKRLSPALETISPLNKQLEELLYKVKKQT